MKEIVQKYKNVTSLAKTNPDRFVYLYEEYIKLMDQHLQTDGFSQNVFKMEQLELFQLFSNVFFDWERILKRYPDKTQAELMKVFKERNHPLSVFLGKGTAYDKDGNRIDPSQFTSADSVKEFFQDMLYALRFVNQAELADYLTLKELDMVQQLKLQNVQELLKIQPALAYQKDETNIPIGKRLIGGYFDCGSTSKEKCPACKQAKLKILEDYNVCNTCFAGYREEF
jgi:hypothetical protein